LRKVAGFFFDSINGDFSKDESQRGKLQANRIFVSFRFAFFRRISILLKFVLGNLKQATTLNVKICYQFMWPIQNNRLKSLALCGAVQMPPP